jgi:hypothetical protein
MPKTFDNTFLQYLRFSLLAACFRDGTWFGLFFDLDDEGDVPPKRRLTFNGLHGVISQKIVLFNINKMSLLQSWEK